MGKRRLVVPGLFSLLMLLAAACGGGDGEPTDTPLATATPQPTATPTPAVDLVALGKEIYTQVPANLGEKAPGPLGLWCSQCHLIDGIPEAAGLIGPDHTNIGRDAAIRIPGVSAEDYLRQSIVDPEAHVAEGVARATPDLMTKEITQGLTDQQVDALVAFLLEQK